MGKKGSRKTKRFKRYHRADMHIRRRSQRGASSSVKRKYTSVQSSVLAPPFAKGPNQKVLRSRPSFRPGTWHWYKRRQIKRKLVDDYRRYHPKHLWPRSVWLRDEQIKAYYKKKGKKLKLSHLSWANPLTAQVCVKRKLRRRMLFKLALLPFGGGQGPVKRRLNWRSYIKC